MGENGRPGDTGLPGRRGDMGLPGMNGTDGTPGRDGLKGMKGMMVGTLLPLHSHTCSCHCLCLAYHNYVEVLIHKMDTHTLCVSMCALLRRLSPLCCSFLVLVGAERFRGRARR